jgi:uncharacterized protein (TIGR00251 family)
MKKDADKPAEKILSLWVQPKASRNEVVGYQGELLRIRVTAPPSGGLANRMCCQLLAKAMGVAPSRIEIISGHSSRKKRVRVQDGDTTIFNRPPAAGNDVRKNGTAPVKKGVTSHLFKKVGDEQANLDKD